MNPQELNTLLGLLSQDVTTMSGPCITQAPKYLLQALHPQRPNHWEGIGKSGVYSDNMDYDTITEAMDDIVRAVAEANQTRKILGEPGEFRKCRIVRRYTTTSYTTLYQDK